jgi:hypothetical protein
MRPAWLGASVFLLLFFCQARLPQAAVIDIMLVYDTTATSWLEDGNGTMEAFSLDVINRMNLAMENSGVDIEFRLAHSVAAGYTHQGDLEDDLDSITYGMGVFSDVHDLRDDYGADLVALLVDTGSAYGWVGLGYLLNSYGGTPNYAFTCNAIRSVAISHTLTHEVGHNLGADHSKYQLSDPGPNEHLDNQYSAGWYFAGGATAYHTIMAYNNDGYGNTYYSAPLFSTPLVSYEGEVAGDAQDGDNARLLRDTMDTVAAYKSVATGSLQITIEPAAAVTAGAQWRRAGTNKWLNSGEVESGLPAGDYIIEFMQISGWNKPSNKPVTVVAGQMTSATGTYTIQGEDEDTIMKSMPWIPLLLLE